jgi:Flp pilus assembly protein TadB
MNAWIGWALVAAAVAAGYIGYGWRGVALAITVTAFWLLLQFSRSLRVLRQAAEAPVGQVASAVMLHSRLHSGMQLPQVLKITRSLGRRVADEPETWAWADAGGDEVHVVLRDGRISSWELKRAGA